MSSYLEATGKTIDESFYEYHQANPVIYTKFKEQVTKALNNGKTKMSSKAILNYIRWEIFVNVSSTDEFKINDAYTSRYARLYIEEHPEHDKIFEMRNLRTRDTP